MNRYAGFPGLICAALFCVPSLLAELNAQTYTTCLGLRWGDGIGVTARQKLFKRTSAEGIFYQHHKSDQAIAGIMLAHHMPVLTRRLNLYIGGGMGIVFPEDKEVASTQYKAFMGNAGLEFTIGRLNMSWDFIPVLPLTDTEESLTTMTAFSLRYVVLKKNKKGLFQKDKKGNKRKHKKKSQKRHQRKK